MSISSISQSSFQVNGVDSSQANMEKAVKKLSDAISSGNLTDAKTALTQMKANAPDGGSDTNNPIGQKVEALSKAIDSGDVSAAQTAFSDLQDTMSKTPQGAPPSGGGQGAPPSGGAGGRSGGSSTATTTKSADSYDPMDTNQDGKVSAAEQLAYELKHATDDSKVSISSSSSYATKGSLDLSA